MVPRPRKPDGAARSGGTGALFDTRRRFFGPSQNGVSPKSLWGLRSTRSHLASLNEVLRKARPVSSGTTDLWESLDNMPTVEWHPD